MSTNPGQAPAHHDVQRPRVRALAGLVGLAAAVGCMLPSAASANELPRYSLKITQGNTTQPEDQIAGISASGPEKSEVRLRILQGGSVVNQQTGTGGAWISGVVPPVGDTVTVESLPSQLVGTIVYDGLPSLDPTVCAGSTNFSGQRSGAETVVGGYYVDQPEINNPYGHIEGYGRTHTGRAQVTTLSGSVFGGNFLVALAEGETVYADEKIETTEPGWIFTYESEVRRPVGGCPAPPPPPPPPPPPVIPSLQASIAKLLSTSIKALLKHGLLDRVYVNQPGTVTQALYLEGGTLPAYAASAQHHHRHKPPALLLAQGNASAKAAEDVTITLHLTARGRRQLLKAKSVHAVLITTVSSSTGTKITLSHRSVALHR